jgi:hypothetical protein
MASISTYLRSNVLGLVAIFIALSGTAYAIDGPLAGQNQVGSDDIINGEVKRDDIASDAVRTGKVLNGTLLAEDIATGAVSSSEVLDSTLSHVDLGTDSVRFSELDPGAFDPAEIAANERDFFFGIADNAIQSEEVSANSLTGSDIANDSIQSQEVSANSLTGSDIFEASLTPSIHAVAVSGGDAELGPTITATEDDPPQNVLTDTIGAGTWIVFAELQLHNVETEDSEVGCWIFTNNTEREEIRQRVAAIDTDFNHRTTLPLTAAFTISTAATLRLACRDSTGGDVRGELRPFTADMVAIPVVSLG